MAPTIPWTERIFAKNADFVFRDVAGEFILVPIRRQLNEVSSIYVLNETGASLWRRIDGKRSVASIIEDFCDEYDVTYGQVERDFRSLAEDLLKIQAIDEPSI